MSFYDEVKEAYICYSENDLKECQKMLFKKGYYWNNGGDKNAVHGYSNFAYSLISPFFKPLIINAKYDKSLGSCHNSTNNRTLLNLKEKLKIFSNRKRKLERILK